MLQFLALLLADTQAPPPTVQKGARVTVTVRIVRESTRAERDWHNSSRKLEREFTDEQGRQVRLRLVEHE